MDRTFRGDSPTPRREEGSGVVQTPANIWTRGSDFRGLDPRSVHGIHSVAKLGEIGVTGPLFDRSGRLGDEAV